MYQSQYFKNYLQYCNKFSRCQIKYRVNIMRNKNESTATPSHFITFLNLYSNDQRYRLHGMINDFTYSILIMPIFVILKENN